MFISLTLHQYEIVFLDGGLEVRKQNQLLYWNHRPIYVSVKDYGGIQRFRDLAYEQVAPQPDGSVAAEGRFQTENGSVLYVSDSYSIEGDALKIARKVIVEKADEKDLGFQTKIFFYEAASDNLLDYDYFSPGQWYMDNRYAASYCLGKNMDLQYYYRKETYSGLPMFAMQHKTTGETISLSRWAPCTTLCSTDRTSNENYSYVDAKMTVGSFGVSKAKPEAQVYTYYGHRMTVPLPKTQCDGVAIDYLYPAMNGQQPVPGRGPWNVEQPLRNINWVHPMREGFSQNYAVAATFGCYDNFREMMKATWRAAYDRLKDRLFDVDNELLFNNIMKFFRTITKSFGSAYGTPFVAQLPDFDPQSFSAEIGFVGQQAGIGYQLLRWGVNNQDEEAVEKGLGILNYWTHETMTETGCPKVWVHLSAHQFEPQPQWVREIGDGLEAILDAYVFEKKRGIEHAEWLDYCVKTADWLLERQNEDGSWYRSYNYDNSICMDSKASTPTVIRFLVQMYLVTKKQDYLAAAVKAGEWTFEREYLGFEYRGGTCDQSDVMDKESGIYCLFAFLSLYDISEEKRWLEAACGAADYVETFTYVADFPVEFPYKHPFQRSHITGASQVTVGANGGDCYMAACSYVYYRLYLLTGDSHYGDFAEFLNRNCKQANDVDGATGYKYIGMINEGGAFSEQRYLGNYHWLPWCNYVEVDPASRFEDTFGFHEIADIEALPLEERQRKNRIYDDYYPF